MTLLALGSAVLVISLPYWLPPVVVALRVRIFARVNGANSVAVPGGLVGVDASARFTHTPAADGRSRGAALSDLFWYWLSPGPHVHQEHLELGKRSAVHAAGPPAHRGQRHRRGQRAQVLRAAAHGPP